MDNDEISKLILTGYRGNIGSAFVDYLTSQCPNIDIIKLNYPNSLQQLHEVVKDKYVKYFINCAGFSENKLSIERPFECFDINSNAVGKQLEIIRRYNPDIRYVNMGSVYEKEKIFTPYATSKRMARNLVQSYCEQYKIFAIQPYLPLVEYFNRKDYFLSKRIVKELIRVKDIYFATGKIKEINISGKEDILDWVWAIDVVEIIWRELNKSVPTKTINIPFHTASIQEFIDIGLNALGVKKFDVRPYQVTSEPLKVSFADIVRGLISHELNKNATNKI